MWRNGERIPSYTWLDTMPESECENCDGSGETIELVDVGVGYLERRETCSVCRGTGKVAP